MSSQASIDECYGRNTSAKLTEYGYEIKCRLGFWGVCAPDQETAEREAKHYFVQYYQDGEYD